MKKYLLTVLFVFSTILTAHAVTVQHQAKSPSFFVPKGAFESNTKQQRVTAQPTVAPAKKQAVIGTPQVAVKAAAQPQIAPTKVQRQAPVQTVSQQQNIKPAQPVKAAAAPATPKVADAAPQQKAVSEFQVSPFQIILNEYSRDTELLAKGQPMNNPRLKNVLADFKNQEHRL